MLEKSRCTLKKKVQKSQNETYVTFSDPLFVNVNSKDTNFSWS